MELAAQTAPFHSLQPRYNLLDREIEAETVPYCEANGIGILPHSPLAKGLLTGKYTPDHQFPADDERSGMSRFQGEEFRQNLTNRSKTASHRSRTEPHTHSTRNRLAAAVFGNHLCPCRCKNPRTGHRTRRRTRLAVDRCRIAGNRSGASRGNKL